MKSDRIILYIPPRYEDLKVFTKEKFLLYRV